MTIVPSDLSEFCSDKQPPKDTDTKLIQLYSCKNAVKCLMDVANYNKEKNDLSNNAILEFNKRKTTHEAKLSRWKKRTDEYAKYRNHGVNNTFFIREVRPDICYWDFKNNEAQAHFECKEAAKSNKKYPDWNLYIAETDSNKRRYCWVSGFQRQNDFGCYKPSSELSRQEAEYQAVKPTFSEQKPKEHVNIPNGVDVRCCSNYLNTGQSAKDNTQVCNQGIDDELKKIKGKKMANDDENDDDYDDENDDDDYDDENDTITIPIPIPITPSKDNNKPTLIIIIIIVIMMVLLSSVILTAGIVIM